MNEKFSIDWNDFEENTIKSVSQLRNEEEFCDVTLVSDDLKRIMAHKVVLASSSEYFKKILKTNKHSHPMLCLTGISSMDLENVLNYVYQGTLMILQEDLERFLNIGKRLRLDGLLAEEKDNQQIEETFAHNVPLKQDQSIKSQTCETPKVTQSTLKDESTYASPITIPVNDCFSVDGIEQKVIEYLGKNENGEYMCNICGKVGKQRVNTKNHIETHLEGISLSCTICGKLFRSRNSMNKHKSIFHKNVNFDSQLQVS